MSKYAKAKGRSGSYLFVMLRHDMMKSQAWRSLSPNARCVWTEIMFRFWKSNKNKSNNNGEIPLSCREAGELCNISKSSANRAFDELIEAGFIKIGTYAGFKNKQRYATRWILTHEDLDGQRPTNEWKS